MYLLDKEIAAIQNAIDGKLTSEDKEILAEIIKQSNDELVSQSYDLDSLKDALESVLPSELSDEDMQRNIKSILANEDFVDEIRDELNQNDYFLDWDQFMTFIDEKLDERFEFQDGKLIEKH